jgi:hypothetical protein
VSSFEAKADDRPLRLGQSGAKHDANSNMPLDATHVEKAEEKTRDKNLSTLDENWPGLG